MLSVNPDRQPITRGLKNFSVQHPGRYPDLKIITAAIFPVSQWYIGFCSLITVTSSYRTYTYFPFHQSNVAIALTPVCLFIQLVKVYHIVVKCQDVKILNKTGLNCYTAIWRLCFLLFFKICLSIIIYWISIKIYWLYRILRI